MFVSSLFATATQTTIRRVRILRLNCSFKLSPWGCSKTHTYHPSFSTNLNQLSNSEMKGDYKKEESNANQDGEKKVSEFITIEDFMKLNLIVGEIKNCQEIEKSKKLYKLDVDCGPAYGGIRTILSGVKPYFSIEEAHTQLVGKKVCVVENLPPKKMAGHHSHGMILFALDETSQTMSSVSIDNSIPNGTRIQ